jgi:hypothetical protein
LVADTSGAVQVKGFGAVLAGGVGGGVEGGVVGAVGTARIARSADTAVGSVDIEARVASLALALVGRVACGAVCYVASLGVSSDEEASKH